MLNSVHQDLVAVVPQSQTIFRTLALVTAAFYKKQILPRSLKQPGEDRLSLKSLNKTPTAQLGLHLLPGIISL